jgi:hypothetical protein
MAVASRPYYGQSRHYDCVAYDRDGSGILFDSDDIAAYSRGGYNQRETSAGSLKKPELNHTPYQRFVSGGALERRSKPKQDTEPTERGTLEENLHESKRIAHTPQRGAKPRARKHVEKQSRKACCKYPLHDEGPVLQGLTSERAPSLHPAACTLQLAPCSLHPAACTLQLAACSLHLAACTLQPAPCSLHPAAGALQLAPCSLHPAACSQQPTPCSLQGAACTLQPASGS